MLLEILKWGQRMAKGCQEEGVGERDAFLEEKLGTQSSIGRPKREGGATLEGMSVT